MSAQVLLDQGKGGVRKGTGKATRSCLCTQCFEGGSAHPHSCAGGCWGVSLSFLKPALDLVFFCYMGLMIFPGEAVVNGGDRVVKQWEAEFR